MPIKIIGPKNKVKIPEDAIFINTTSHSKNWTRAFSPFLLGPCELYGGLKSHNVENAWQFCKVYKEHIDENGNPTEGYWKWAQEGWSSKRGIRYPMGKGAKPEYSFWDGYKLNYIEARKIIYVPLYYKAVKDTDAYKKLKELYKEGKLLYLWDFDGYDNEELGMSLIDVLNCPDKTMGHAFVLARMLELDK